MIFVITIINFLALVDIFEYPEELLKNFDECVFKL